MVKRHKRRKFSGRVCEQIVYTVAGGADPKTSRPKKPRFQSQEEREEFNTRISAAKFAALVNANFSPTSYYSTLTLDSEHEVHTAQEMRRIRDKLYRRLVYHYPKAKIVIVYGRGKSTSRFHLHLITDGIPADELGRLWGLGSVIDCKPLRKHNYYLHEKGNKVDHGQDYTALANYLHGHWRKESSAATGTRPVAAASGRSRSPRPRRSGTTARRDRQSPRAATSSSSPEPRSMDSYISNMYGIPKTRHISGTGAAFFKPCKCVEFLRRRRKELNRCRNRDTGGTGMSAAPSANTRN